MIGCPGGRTGVGERWKDQKPISADEDTTWHSETEDHPFGLLTLEWTGDTPVAVELDECKRRHRDERHEIEKQNSVGILRERVVWEKRGKDEHCETPDSDPARPARHELPSRKQEKDEHEESKSEEGQACGRHLPGGGTCCDGAGRVERAKSYEHERDQHRHAVVGPTPDDQCADHQTHHDGGKRKGDVGRCVVAERQANPFEHLCLRRRE